MKIIAAMEVDLEVTPIGTQSQLARELGGVTVLRRTVEQVRRMQHVAALHVRCPSQQVKRCQTLLDGTDAVVRPRAAGPPPWGSLVRAARKWSLDGWRGGIGGTTCFDEYVDCRLLAELLESVEADAVLCVPPAAPLLDPALADKMIDYRRTVQDQTRVVFTQAPPGVTGILLDAELIRDIGQQNAPVGWLFSYQPDNPRKDPIFQSACCEIPLELRHATGRLIADTDRAMQTVHDLLQHNDPLDADTIGRLLRQRELDSIETLPREVEIELTTDDPYPDALYRPRGARVGRRGPIDLRIVEQVVEELSRFDDSLLVLGGFGEPLRHPQFEKILDLIRPQRGNGVYGLCVRTAGVDLTDGHIKAMIAHRVDVLNVTLDAWTSELYSRLQSPNNPASADLEAVQGRLDRLTQIRMEQRSVHPVLVPEFTKARENLDEL
ncbi:MAG: radical SAM protein [Planctomycetes bacterium]|nr:radical SAM protein [Planctomycetota bacterium]